MPSGRATRADLSEPRRPGRHRRIEADEDLDSDVGFVLGLDGPGAGRHSLERDNRASTLDLAAAGFLITEPDWAPAADTATAPTEIPKPTAPKPHLRSRPAPGATSRRRSASDSLWAR